MELRTGFNCIDNIIHGGFKASELFTLCAMKAPEVNWRETAAMNWPHRKDRDAHYAMHYKIDGVDTLDYFQNCKELHFWYKLQEMRRKDKGIVTEIITLYVWDAEKGPVEVEDIIPHFQHFQRQVFANIFQNDIDKMYGKRC